MRTPLVLPTSRAVSTKTSDTVSLAPLAPKLPILPSRYFANSYHKCWIYMDGINHRLAPDSVSWSADNIGGSDEARTADYRDAVVARPDDAVSDLDVGAARHVDSVCVRAVVWSGDR